VSAAATIARTTNTAPCAVIIRHHLARQGCLGTRTTQADYEDALAVREDMFGAEDWPTTNDMQTGIVSRVLCPMRSPKIIDEADSSRLNRFLF
jgi:hypothetical protein